MNINAEESLLQSNDPLYKKATLAKALNPYYDWFRLLDYEKWLFKS